MSWRLTAGKLRDAWRDYPAARRGLQRVSPGRPIFLTGTHRSGTTWLAKMLAASGIWYVHEPFAPMKGRWSECFTYRESDVQDPSVDRLFTEVLKGGFRRALHMPHSDHPWMPLRLFPHRPRRLLVKDPLGCLLTEYLTRRFDLETLILFRHPAGFASSVHRLGWPRGSFLRQFLADEPLMRRHLSPYREVLERFCDEDSLSSATALHGALSTVLWRFVEQGVGQALSFEEICSNPVPALRDLFQRVGLPYADDVEDFHRQACYGERKQSDSYHPHAVVRNSRAMAEGWKGQLSASQVDEVRRVWESFDLPLYRDAAAWS